VRAVGITLGELDALIAAAMANDARQLGPRQLAAIEAQMWQRAAAPRRLPIAGVVERLRHLIEAGYLLPGDVLPTRPELAARYQLSLSAVSRATSLLVREGVLEARHEGYGRGIRLHVAQALPGLVEQAS
jgi:Bacterial regulatory proteins, gntR family